MSEHPNFSNFHHKGERMVKGVIRGGGDQYEIAGRESDPRVAEAMAYAAKPLIDSVLRKMETGEPNPLALMEDKKTGNKYLTAAPGVMHENALTGGKYTTSYGQLAGDVRHGHAAANKVQVEYYDKLTEASKLAREAKDNL